MPLATNQGITEIRYTPHVAIQDEGTRALFASEVAAAMLASDYLAAVLKGEWVETSLWAVANFPHWDDAPGVKYWIKTAMETWGELLRGGYPVQREFGAMLSLYLAMHYRSTNLRKHHRRTNLARLRYDYQRWAERVADRDYGALALIAHRGLAVYRGD